MDYLIDTILIGITAVSTYLGTRALISIKNSDKIKLTKINDGSYPFLYNGKYYAFVCPKCNSMLPYKTTKSKLKTIVNQPEYCECVDYFNGHYHFTCPACKFKCIMRTYDNK